jgi:chaperonin GroES
MKNKPAIEPFSDYVLVSPTEAQERSEGGIYLPETTREKQQTGTVITAGPGRHLDGSLVPCQAKAGDKVIFKKYAGDEIEIDGEDYLMIRETDILGRECR